MGFKFELGTILKDKVTGFKGVLMGRSDYVTGCRQYGLQKQGLDEQGKVPDWAWFDEGRLKVVGKKKVLNQEEISIDVTGGPEIKQARYS